ncbi:MAG: aminoacetone oxidase family FAD-binding enzyme, partial [Bacteroidales bacterium]|nr:aminoacetone oxidase family FAD-binding enzyme [Bacteroidales bacterium]
MFSDIIVIGGGAAGLAAACGAARTLVDAGSAARVTVLEKMPRPGRKIMITGKGRCNFTNVKDWNAFSAHIRTNPNFLKPSFYNFTPSEALDFFSALGMQSVVERGDRAYPASHHASDVVDALVRACHGAGVKIETEVEVKSVGPGLEVVASDGRKWTCSRLIIATGGMSYPTTGSTGDGYRFAEESGHTVTPLFPSLTALVPRGYKLLETKDLHIDRSTPLSELGKALCGVQLKNVGVQLLVEGSEAQSEFGDIDFTDGGIEGPVGFQLSRKAVKSMINGSRVSLVLDLKPGVPLSEITARVKELWQEVDKDPRSKRLHEKEK